VLGHVFMFCVPDGTSYYGATGVGATSRLVRRCQVGCLCSNLVTGLRGSKSEHACCPVRDVNERVPIGGHLPEGLHSDKYGQIMVHVGYMQRNHPRVYLSHCFSANNLAHKLDT